jgi:hypothetical protein
MRQAALSIALILSACSEIVDERYASWNEAEQAGAVERGWVPPFVPAAARNLRSVHDLDLNSNRLTFELPPEAVQPMIDRISPVSQLRGEALEVALDEAGWNRRRVARVTAHMMCTQTYSGAIVAERDTGHIVYLSPAEWGREQCPRPL